MYRSSSAPSMRRYESTNAINLASASLGKQQKPIAKDLVSSRNASLAQSSRFYNSSLTPTPENSGNAKSSSKPSKVNFPKTGESTMGQVAFDTQEFVETLENSGLPKDQARAISIAVRKSHEVADVATKADIVEVKHDIAEVNRNIADVRKDLSAKIAEVRKELSAEVAGVRKDLAFDIADARKEAADRADAKIELLHKDIESLTNKLVIKMASIMVGAIGVATAIIKLL
uniref:DUF1640 domain-containing protein n=1 Tax=Glossina brevipalpis TaxID=37001 RepID=A0A1A9VZ10_9MUSC